MMTFYAFACGLIVGCLYFLWRTRKQANPLNPIIFDEPEFVPLHTNPEVHARQGGL